ncbi:MAG: IclR family transcriptional regulator [Proteobacteria bacterium]|nr:IclR family transcriptional regulator [Pseudomonadota bacterium]
MPKSSSPRATPAAPEDASVDPTRNFGIAIARAFDILRCFTPERSLLGNSDLVRLSGLPRSTVSRLAFTLEELGYLYRLSPIGKYRLGWGVVSLGYPLLTSMALRHIARPEMHALAARLKVNVNMGTLHRTSVVYLESVHFDETSTTRPDIGAPRSLLSSAIGRALIWSLDERRRTALLNRAAIAEPEAFARTKAKLAQARKSLVASGFCLSLGETRQGYSAVSVPMRVVSYEEPIAFNCATADHRMRKDRLQNEVGPALVAMVTMLEHRVGIR